MLILIIIPSEYNTMKTLLTFLSIYITCFILDMFWLGLIATNLYKNAIGDLMRKSGSTLTPNWPAAMIVYFIITMGIMMFVLPKVENTPVQALLWGGCLGAVIYGVYDFTNYSVLNNWPLSITLIDFLWGITLCAFSSVAGALVKKLF